MKPPEKLGISRLKVHAAISDNAPFEDLEHRAMAREILEFRENDAPKKTLKKYSKKS